MYPHSSKIESIKVAATRCKGFPFVSPLFPGLGIQGIRHLILWVSPTCDWLNPWRAARLEGPNFGILFKWVSLAVKISGVLIWSIEQWKASQCLCVFLRPQPSIGGPHNPHDQLSNVLRTCHGQTTTCVSWGDASTLQAKHVYVCMCIYRI